jgi:K(+)-stimulated pyrophosphate-energized sodium pump
MANLLAIAGAATARLTNPAGGTALHRALAAALALLCLSAVLTPALASEADLILPDVGSVSFLGMSGRTLLMMGIAICLLGGLFGLTAAIQLKNLPVHRSMREISELIYETCKTYLITQGKFILLLELCIGIIMAVYFGALRHFEVTKVAMILLFSLIGIAGSYGVAWFGIRVNTYANSRSAFASLRGKPFPTYAIPLRAGCRSGCS